MKRYIVTRAYVRDGEAATIIGYETSLRHATILANDNADATGNRNVVHDLTTGTIVADTRKRGMGYQSYYGTTMVGQPSFLTSLNTSL
jgi:hypothetical protein